MKIDFTNSAFKTKGNSFFLPVFLSLFLGILGCTHKIATDKLPQTQIIFGHGGGFVGVERQHALLPDGRIIRLQRDSPTQNIVKNIGETKAASYYAEVEALRLRSLLYNVPGNVFHYIVLVQDGKRANKIVWDGGNSGDKNAPANIEAFYQKLRAELPKKKEKD
jgi:hypothetical protein